MKAERNQFILDHAEKTLVATIADAEHLGQNSIYTSGVFLMALSACGAILTSTSDTGMIAASIVSGAYLLIHAKKFADTSLSARSIKLPGNLAANLQKPPYGQMSVSDLVLSEAKGYDERIKVNAARNRTTGVGLNTAIRGLLRFPVVFVATWVVVKSIVFVVGSL